MIRKVKENKEKLCTQGKDMETIWKMCIVDVQKTQSDIEIHGSGMMSNTVLVKSVNIWKNENRKNQEGKVPKGKEKR